MRAVIQRVSQARVDIAGEKRAEIGGGLLILLGVSRDDAEEEARKLAAKIAALRIFPDGAGKMNRSIIEQGGSLLVVSNFTLYADSKKGNRPSFDTAASGEMADHLYKLFLEALEQQVQKPVCRGEFGADMQVALVNDGPVTILLDTDVWKRKTGGIA